MKRFPALPDLLLLGLLPAVALGLGAWAHFALAAGDAPLATHRLALLATLTVGLSLLAFLLLSLYQRSQAKLHELEARTSGLDAQSSNQRLEGYARELEHARAQLDRLAVMREVVLAVNDDLAVEAALARVLPIIAQQLEAEALTIALREGPTGPAKLRVHWVGGRLHDELESLEPLRRELEAAWSEGLARGRTGPNWSVDPRGATGIFWLEANRELFGVFRVRLGPGAGDRAALERAEEMVRQVGHPLALALDKSRLYDRAIYDALTGLYNKRHFQEESERLAGIARRRGAPLSLLVLDIDHFKQVNDRHGHASGDLVLAGVAGVVAETVRESDLAFRYGGEEICVLCPDTPVAEAVVVAERLRSGIEAARLKGDQGQDIPVTVSIGLAGLLETHANVGELFALSDRALYRAKEGGRNRVEIGIPEAAPASSQPQGPAARGRSRRATRRRPAQARPPQPPA